MTSHGPCADRGPSHPARIAIPSWSERQARRAVVLSTILAIGLLACGGPQTTQVVVVRPTILGASLYDSLASRAIPLGELNQRAEAASAPAQLMAREEDAFDDDLIFRNGRVVFLGKEGQSMVGFTLRRLVDMSYPVDEEPDGVGPSEWREHILTLTVAGTHDGYLLQPLPENGIQVTRNDVAYVRLFGNNDIALVYFPIASHTVFASGERSIADLGIDSPTAFVADLIERSSNLFGFKFVLISEESFTQMQSLARDNTSAFSSVVIKAAILFAAAAYFLPALGVSELSLGSFGLDQALNTIASLGSAEGFWAEALPIAIHLGKSWLEESGILDMMGPEGKLVTGLLLARLPAPTSIEGKALMDFVGGVLGELTAQSVPFERGAKTMLFIPNSKVNVNYEVVRQGYAKLDVDDKAALGRFPEFLQAAEDALGDGHNAATYRLDQAYVDSLRAARAKFPPESSHSATDTP